MSLVRIRRSSRVIAAILLAASMLQFPHPSLDDEACTRSRAEAHDESKHVFTSATSPSHPDHCAICHWTRWVKPVFAARPAETLDRGGSGELAASNARVFRDPSADRLPPRAPPAL